MDGAGENGRPGGGGRGRWWWWALVALLALLVVFLFVRGGGGGEGGDADREPGSEVTTPSLEPIDEPESGAAGLTIGGEAAEPLLHGGNLSEHVGEDVLGTAVVVDSVIAEGVYWVGEGRAQILLVAPEGQAPPIAPGNRVTFRGTLRELDDETRDAIWGAEAERTVEGQGAYVALAEIAPAG